MAAVDARWISLIAQDQGTGRRPVHFVILESHCRVGQASPVGYWHILAFIILPRYYGIFKCDREAVLVNKKLDSDMFLRLAPDATGHFGACRSARL